MLRVRDIMTPNVVTIGPQNTLREAIDTLVSCRIGGIPVVEGDRVVGVLAAADLLEFEAVTPMSHHLDRTDDEADDLCELEGEWEDEAESPSAFFTDLWTDEGVDVAVRLASSEGPERDFLSEHTVGEAMTRSVCAVPATTDVPEVARRMLAAGVQRALVTEGDTFVGIVTTTDIVRAVADHRLIVRHFVFPRGVPA